jgi:type IV pilus assembly protein PilE
MARLKATDKTKHDERRFLAISDGFGIALSALTWHPSHMNKGIRMKSKGFTLIELLVVIAIVGILAAIAIPSFNEQVAKSRRSEAMRGLGDLQLRQERWRANNTSYGTYANLGSPTIDHYTLTVNGPAGTGNPDGTGYTLTATRSGVQTGDRCGNFVLTVNNTTNSVTKSLSGGSNTSNCNWP